MFSITNEAFKTLVEGAQCHLAWRHFRTKYKTKQKVCPSPNVFVTALFAIGWNLVCYILMHRLPLCVFFLMFTTLLLSLLWASSQCVQWQADNELRQKKKLTTDWCKIWYTTFHADDCKLTVDVHKVGATNHRKSQSCDPGLSASVEVGQIILKVQHLAMISGH